MQAARIEVALWLTVQLCSGNTLQSTGFGQQGATAPAQHFTGRRQYRATALHPEQLDIKQICHSLNRIGDCGLGLVERLGGLRIAARIDDCNESAPLFERNSGLIHIGLLDINRYILPFIIQAINIRLLPHLTETSLA